MPPCLADGFGLRRRVLGIGYWVFKIESRGGNCNSLNCSTDRGIKRTRWDVNTRNMK